MSQIRKINHFINRKWLESKTDRYKKVINLAIKEVMTLVRLSTKTQQSKVTRIAHNTLIK